MTNAYPGKARERLQRVATGTAAQYSGATGRVRRSGLDARKYEAVVELPDGTALVFREQLGWSANRDHETVLCSGSGDSPEAALESLSKLIARVDSQRRVKDRLQRRFRSRQVLV